MKDFPHTSLRDGVNYTLFAWEGKLKACCYFKKHECFCCCAIHKIILN